MKRLLFIPAILLSVSLQSFAGDDSPASYPKPSPVPISWELKFEHSTPRRIVVNLPGDPTPRAYWYFTYSVLNNSDQQSNYDPDHDKERIFYPLFILRMEDGKLLPGNDGIHPAVFDAIKAYERIKYLEDPTLMGGRILIGEDQVRQSVAVWAEPSQRMGTFQIFASGMWGETAVATDSNGNAIKDANGDEVLLHKTLDMTYHVDGDSTHFSNVRKLSEEFIMR